MLITDTIDTNAQSNNTNLNRTTAAVIHQLEIKTDKYLTFDADKFIEICALTVSITSWNEQEYNRLDF